MTDKKMFEEVFPQSKQIGGNHYKSFHIQPYEFIILVSFKAML
jgi:hypothetical protein